VDPSLHHVNRAGKHLPPLPPRRRPGHEAVGPGTPRRWRLLGWYSWMFMGSAAPSPNPPAEGKNGQVTLPPCGRVERGPMRCAFSRSLLRRFDQFPHRRA
jgi:hypothetical protein